MNLNLPVPFQAGDLIYVNGFPYAIAFPMLILTVGDNRSCCSVRALSKTADDTWYIGSVNMGELVIFLSQLCHRFIRQRFGVEIWELEMKF